MHERAQPGITYATLLLLFLALTASTGVGYSLAQHRDSSDKAFTLPLAPTLPKSTTSTGSAVSQPKQPILTSDNHLALAAQNVALKLIGKHLSPALQSQFVATYQAAEKAQQANPTATNRIPSPEDAADAFIRSKFPDEVKSPYTANVSDFNDQNPPTH